MKMKKMILTLVALLSMTVVMAQNDNKKLKAPKEVNPEEVTNRMVKELDLTADQKAKVLKLNTEYKDVLRGPGMGRGHKGGPRPDGQKGANEKQQRPERPQLTDAQKKEMKENFEKQMEKRKEYDKKMQEVLTEAQYKKFMSNNRGRRPADAPKK